ncbi:hypothetical protein ACM39_00760 [Chryseobacterium sp. FH2]|uniref:hypothetical protein n=1 Tax=Chryseobacterium sp. FH2 TaxID=1674291 RepID=UPI00065ACE5D|nr:hypothetical protein [Chryseobacterium sp. FH2]KMQ69629.1 hypothetical protein ACM39_00760 [Chryseobacterium sp. FH2]
MKKILLILTVSIFTFSFSQQNNTNIKVEVNKNQIEKVYPKGLDRFEKDLAGNLQYTANEYQVLGDFKLNFTVDKNGKISDIKISPEVFDTSFEKEVKRDISRMAKHFASAQKENISVDLSFSRGYNPLDSRINYASSNK